MTRRTTRSAHVKDVLLSKDGNVAAVIVGVGGFLGVGEKDVAVPFNTLALQEKNGDTRKKRCRAPPGYSYDRERGQWVPRQATKLEGHPIMLDAAKGRAIRPFHFDRQKERRLKSAPLKCASARHERSPGRGAPDRGWQLQER
jgi:hypothetical protein